MGIIMSHQSLISLWTNQDSVYTLDPSFTLYKILCSIQKQVQCKDIWFYIYTYQLKVLDSFESCLQIAYVLPLVSVQQVLERIAR